MKVKNSNFVDYVKIFCRSGKGGAGSTHFLRDRNTAKGGPDGGDGGYGGHIIVKGNEQMWTLLHLKYQKHIFAEHGGIGSGNHKHGKDGISSYLEVPLGTIGKDAETGDKISAMLSLKVEDDELIRRLLARGKDSGRADDQDESIIANRINEYNNKTAPLKDYYSTQNKLSEIKGNGTVEDIASKLNNVIDTL